MDYDSEDHHSYLDDAEDRAESSASVKNKCKRCNTSHQVHRYDTDHSFYYMCTNCFMEQYIKKCQLEKQIRTYTRKDDLDGLLYLEFNEDENRSEGSNVVGVKPSRYWLIREINRLDPTKTINHLQSLDDDDLLLLAGPLKIKSSDVHIVELKQQVKQMREELDQLKKLISSSKS